MRKLDHARKIKAPGAADPGQSDSLLPPGWSFLGDPSALLRDTARSRTTGARATGGVLPAGASPAAAEAGGSAPQSAPDASAPPVTGLWLPLGEMTPVAAFCEAGRLFIVSGGRHALDVAGLGDAGVWGPVAVATRGDLTVVSMACPQGGNVTVAPESAGWKVSLATPGTVQARMLIGQEGGALAFAPPAQDELMRAVDFLDPVSGRRLLLGLARSGGITPDLVRRGAGFAIRPSLTGVVVAADLDDLELRVSGGRFLLDVIGPDSEPLLAQGRFASDGASLAGVRLVEPDPGKLPDEMYHAWMSAVTATAGQKFNARMRLAQVAARSANGPLVSGVMQTALEDQPEGAARSDVRRLRQIAAVLNARSSPELLSEEEGAAPEDQFWRGMVRATLFAPDRRDLDVEDASLDTERRRAASMIAAGLPAVASYAPSLRHRLLHPAMEWVGRYGDPAARAAAAALPKTEDTALGLAMIAARDHAPDATARLDAVSRSPSPVIWPAAREAALRLAFETGSRSPAEVAAGLDGLMPGFRVAGCERDARLLQIDALLKAGDWRGAARAVIEGQGIFGGRSFPGRDRLMALTTAVSGEVPKPQDDAMAEAAMLQRLLSRTDDPAFRAPLLKALAARYDSLGLPVAERDTLRALAGLLPDAEKGPVMVRLAGLDLKLGDAGAASGDLPEEATATPAVSALPGAGAAEADTGSGMGDAEATALVRARIFLARHDPGAALAMLKDLHGEEALALKADLTEQTADWSGAVAALTPLVEARTRGPADQPLAPEQRDLILRLAGDASRAQDTATLARLKDLFGARVAGTPSATLFNLLTGGPTATKPSGTAPSPQAGG